MRRMKDSGIAWIGEIPEGWKVRKVKSLASDNDTLFMDGDWIESDIIESDGIRYLTTGNIGTLFFKEQGAGYISNDAFKNLKCLAVYPGDLAISRLNAPLGRACLIPDEEKLYVVAVDIVILRPNKDISKNFLLYSMNVDSYNFYVKLYARGTTMPRISRTILGNMILPIPPLPEQHRIAAYLDAKCTEIDRSMELARQGIDKLKEYKKSVITEAVTKGLDPDVPMKDSGVPWIGEIPEGWDVRKTKQIFSVFNGSTPKSDHAEYWGGDIVWITPAEMGEHIDVIKCSRRTLTNLGLSSCGTTIVPINSIIISSRAPIGQIAIAGLELCTNQGCKSLVKKYTINEKYFFYFFKIQLETLTMLGNGTTFLELSSFELGNFLIPAPTLSEQHRIAAYLDAKCAEIDAIIARKQELLDKLAAYKKSLIFECVTGKREVAA